MIHWSRIMNGFGTYRIFLVRHLKATVTTSTGFVRTSGSIQEVGLPLEEWALSSWPVSNIGVITFISRPEAMGQVSLVPSKIYRDESKTASTKYNWPSREASSVKGDNCNKEFLQDNSQFPVLFVMHSKFSSVYNYTNCLLLHESQSIYRESIC